MDNCKLLNSNSKYSNKGPLKASIICRDFYPQSSGSRTDTA